MALLALGGLAIGAVAGTWFGLTRAQEKEEEEKERLESKRRKRERREREARVKHVTEEVWDEDKLRSAVEKNLSELEIAKSEEDKQRQREREQQLINHLINDVLENRLPLLKKYKIGDMIGHDEFKYNGLEITFDDIRLIVFGPTGSGKSCFINMAQQVMEGKDIRKISAISQSSGVEGTIILDPYLETEGFQFHLVDTRGFFGTGDTEAMDELMDILSGRIEENDTIYRKSDVQEYGEEATISLADRAEKDDPELEDRVHGIICILDYDDPRFDDYKDAMKPYREFFKKQGISPTSVVMYTTEGERSEEEKIYKTLEAATAMGASKDRTFILKNHVVDDNCVVTKESKTTITKIFETVLIGAESYIKQKLLEDKYQKENATEDKDIGPLLDEWKKKYLWTEDELSTLTGILSDLNISTVDGLKIRWENVKCKIPASAWGIADLIEKDLLRI